MDYKIIGDSCVDTNEKLEEELQITKVPFSITLGKKLFIDDGSIDLPSFLKEMNAHPEGPKTAAPAPGGFLEALEGAKEAYIVTISSKLSASYANAQLAIEMAKEKSDLKAAVVDAKSSMAGEALVALKIKEYKDKGLPFEEVAKKAQDFVNEKMNTLFVLETFDNLIKNGRMSAFKGKVASLLHISPVMYADDGEIKTLEIVRGRKKSLRRLVEAIGEQVEDTKDRILVIAHCNNEKRAQEVYDMIVEKYTFRRIEIVPTTGLGGVYANQGGIVMAF